MIEVITSMSQTYYDLIGKDCLHSFLQYWPQQFKLHVYVEELVLEDHYRIKQTNFSKLDPDYQAFQLDPNCNQSEKKFAKKAYSVMHAMNHSPANWIIWLDADVVTTAPIPETFWHALLDDQHLSMYMGVHYTLDKTGNAGHWLVPETGVFAVNTKHKEFKNLRYEYCRRYHKRDKTNLRRFYDNDVFGAAIKHATGSTHRDLCAQFDKPYKTPLRHTVLGPYLKHYKAKHSKAEYGQETEDEDQ